MNTQTQVNTFDYIIAGSGCAGLSLLYRMLLEPSLNTKKILVVDQIKKTKDDRTWCFWEKEAGLFQSLVHHQWSLLDFKSEFYTKTLNISPYTYKMITGLDFYKHVYTLAEQFPNVTFRYENIETMRVVKQTPEIKTKKGVFRASYIFNSTKLFYPQKETKRDNSLLMQFKGWTIKTDQNCFANRTGTLMDFNVDQHTGIAFMYMLPTSDQEALIEYTLINENPLKPAAYTTALSEYIHNNLNIDNFQILQQESGIIPMSKAKFPTHHQKKIIHIGTAGGCVKASSGYAFQFIQNQTTKIVERLKQNQSPVVKFTFSDMKFHCYDKTFLEVIISERMRGDELMASIFKKNEAANVLCFLGNESKIKDDYRIMRSLPAHVFLPVALKQVL